MKRTKWILSALTLVLLAACMGGFSLSAYAESTMVTFPSGITCEKNASELDLSALKHSQVEAATAILSGMPNLKYVSLSPAKTEQGSETTPETSAVDSAEALTWADIAAIQDACGEADVEYRFTFMGYDFSTLDEVFDLNHLKMTDNGEAVREILPCMRKCKVLDMDFCDVDDEHMAAIRADYPDIDVIWRIWFGDNCSVRTDVERILSSNLDHNLQDYNTKALKYCTKVKYLDIGHQHVTDISFLANMKDLEVCVIAINPLSDLSPISACTKLEYLEIACTYATDLTPLGALTNLEHLSLISMCGDHLEGWEALANCKQLKRLWLAQDHTCNLISSDKLAFLQESLPNTEINSTDTTLVFSWRYVYGSSGQKTERYELLCKQFEYDDYPHVCAYPKNDPKYYGTR